jgi:hypothetical protein
MESGTVEGRVVDGERGADVGVAGAHVELPRRPFPRRQVFSTKSGLRKLNCSRAMMASTRS